MEQHVLQIIDDGRATFTPRQIQEKADEMGAVLRAFMPVTAEGSHGHDSLSSLSSLLLGQSAAQSSSPTSTPASGSGAAAAAQAAAAPEKRNEFGLPEAMSKVNFGLRIVPTGVQPSPSPVPTPGFGSGSDGQRVVFRESRPRIDPGGFDAAQLLAYGGPRASRFGACSFFVSDGPFGVRLGQICKPRPTHSGPRNVLEPRPSAKAQQNLRHARRSRRQRRKLSRRHGRAESARTVNRSICRTPPRSSRRAAQGGSSATRAVLGET